MSVKQACQYLLFFLLFALVISCAPAYQKPKADLAWPMPPDEPRIKYVDFLRSTLDVGKEKSTVSEALFGEENIDVLNKPYGVAVDKQGVIYATELGRVFAFDVKNKRLDFVGTEPGQGQVSFPVGICFSDDGRLFITDNNSDRVYVYRNRKYIASIGVTGDFDSPSGIAIDDKRGVIYIVDSKKHAVGVYSLKDYSKLRTIGRRGPGPGEFNYPTNAAVDSEGRLYVVDTANFRVQIFDSEGNHLKSFGKPGDALGAFARPKGIAIDSDNNIYVADAYFGNFQIFDKDGNLLLFVGEKGKGPGKFWLPAGIAIDHEDKIYVVDQIPGTIQIFQYLGGKWKKSQEVPAAAEKGKVPAVNR